MKTSDLSSVARLAAIASVILVGCTTVPGANTGGSGSTSSASTTGSSTQSDASSTASTSGTGGSPPTCPTGLPGPALVLVEAQAGAATDSFCIDATEVTRSQYKTFLMNPPPLESQPAECSFNTTFSPAPDGVFECGDWALDLTAFPNLPVKCIDWCDAAAYCASAQKRLCGAIGGGAADYEAFADPKTNEWMAACSAGGSRAYPYGDVFIDQACKGQGGGASPVDVGSATGCEGGVPGVFDMSGNVAEFESLTNGASGPMDQVRIRGGSYAAGPADLLCAAPGATTRQTRSGRVGFRCCADVVE